MMDKQQRDKLLDELVASYESGELAGLLAWWKEWKGSHVPGDLPHFRKDLPSHISGMRVKREIIERVQKKIRKDKVRSVSALVEFLLWRYIGSPRDLLEGEGREGESTEDVE